MANNILQELEACLTTDEVLVYLKVTPRTIYRLIRTGELPGDARRTAVAVPADGPRRLARAAVARRPVAHGTTLMERVMTKAVWSAAAAAAVLFVAITGIRAGDRHEDRECLGDGECESETHAQFGDGVFRRCGSGRDAEHRGDAAHRGREDADGGCEQRHADGAGRRRPQVGVGRIAINNLTWTASGAGVAAGTMSKTTAQWRSARWTGSGKHTGLTQTYALANSWAYATGSYGAVVTYTLTAP